MKLKAPFPWFGGKSRAAHLVWPRFGQTHNYSEPFAGSLAVLLARPHAPRVETVNDLDCYLSNFWRSVERDPEQVAYYADHPINEADLHARHRWLVQTARERAELVMTDSEFYDARIAGEWVWGQCLWIGSGWCQTPRTDGAQHKGIHVERTTSGVDWKSRPDLSSTRGRGQIQRTAASFKGENPVEQRKRPRGDGEGGVLAQGLWVPRKRFAGVGNGQGAGVHRRRWQGGGQGGGSGVHAPSLTRQKPQLSGERSGAARGLLGRTEGLYEYLALLSDRLRRVRVCCGDWTRVLTPSVTTYIGTTAVFLDPPYGHELRERCYSEDHDVAQDVRAWALEHGDDPKFRIALCGYEGEHDMPDTWEVVPWKAHGGYSRTARGKANRSRERIWFSPHCLRPSDDLFGGLGLA